MRSTPSLASILAIVIALIPASGALAEGTYVGSKKCKDCHELEFDVWEGSTHSKSYRYIHRDRDKVTSFLKAIDGARSLREDATCVQCHYAKNPGERASAAISCEKCHGAASGWMTVHNNYGGDDVTKEQESAAHKKDRIAKSNAAGMIRPSMLYDIAANCMECHGFAHPGVKGDKFAKLLAAGHPINPDYELVAYSQGEVRHRFYPYGSTTNKPMTKAELSQLYVIGQAAKLVSAAQALKGPGASDEAYRKAQEKRLAEAKATLSKVSAASGLISSPTPANARKLEAAIEGKDLSGQVSLPPPSSYKTKGKY